MKSKITHHLSLMLITAFTGMLILEYYGWMIVEKMKGESRFPGFLSGEVITSVFVSSMGVLLVGFLFMLIAFVFPGFRRNWRRNIHIPLWTGVLTSIFILALLVMIGLYSV